MRLKGLLLRGNVKVWWRSGCLLPVRATKTERLMEGAVIRW
jgi:hypothetical protein